MFCRKTKVVCLFVLQTVRQWLDASLRQKKTKLILQFLLLLRAKIAPINLPHLLLLVSLVPLLDALQVIGLVRVLVVVLEVVAAASASTVLVVGHR